MQALRRASSVCVRAACSGLMPQRSASVASSAVFFGQVCARCHRVLLPRSPSMLDLHCACLRSRLALPCVRPLHSRLSRLFLIGRAQGPLPALFHPPPFVLLGQPACGLLVSYLGAEHPALRLRVDERAPNNWTPARRGFVPNSGLHTRIHAPFALRGGLKILFCDPLVRCHWLAAPVPTSTAVCALARERTRNQTHAIGFRARGVGKDSRESVQSHITVHTRMNLNPKLFSELQQLCCVDDTRQRRSQRGARCGCHYFRERAARHELIGQKGGRGAHKER